METEKYVSMAQNWIKAWNSRDMEEIMSHYADDIDFQSATVIRTLQRPDGRLKGKKDLREHFTRGLANAPKLHFTLEQVFFNPGGYGMLYSRENGNRVIECMELNEQGLVIRSRIFYAQPPV